MSICLTRRLERFVRLSDAERAAVSIAAGEKICTFAARRDIVVEGDKPTAVNLMLEGWAARYKMLEDGRRQVLSFLIPGDICDLSVYILRRLDHSIGSITRATVARMGPATFDKLSHSSPRLAQAFLWDSLVSIAVQREWTLNIGQRTAVERIAHLFCELYRRLDAVGLVDGNRATIPVTQTDVAEATGLSVVHVNRSLQELRRQGLLQWSKGVLEVPDLPALEHIAMFDDNYLHLDREGAHLNAND